MLPQCSGRAARVECEAVDSSVARVPVSQRRA
jgi:hypothetical protein